MKKSFWAVVFLTGMLCLIGLQSDAFSAKASSMSVSARGRAFIKEHEGLSLTAYNDGYGTVTIGWGHTMAVTGSMTITTEQAEAYLSQDLAVWEAAVNNFASNNNITFTQNQFDALVSLEFNVGSGPLGSDTRLRRLIKNNISGNSVQPPVSSVWEGFATWHHAGGVDSKGLFYRRMNEARLFAMNDYSVNRNWSIPSWLTNGSAGPEVPDGWVPDEYPVPGPTTTPGQTTPPPGRTVNAAYSAYVPFSTYALSTGKVTVYDNNGNAYSQSTHYIDGANDICVIQQVYTDGFCAVKYPSSSTSSGYYTALGKLSDFISSPSPTVYTANDKYPAYRRSSGDATIGSVFSGDKCLAVSSANGRTQVIYPAGSSYKMGWIIASTPTPTIPPDESYKTPFKAYPIGTGRIPVYAQAGGSPEENRYIDGSTDLCMIEEIYTNGWCKVTYPIANGTRTAYTQTSVFIAGSMKVAWSATLDQTAYRRSTGDETIGSVSAGDRCVKVAEENGRIQLMYPVTGTNYYKLGWVDKPVLNPQGAYDSATGGLYSVSVSGWAFDRDNLNQALTIKVYAGSNLIGTCIANQSRPDVNNAYPGVGNNHGFAATFDMSKYTGSQSIKVVAVNVGSGSDATLGTKTVTVTTDTTKPVISNVKVTNLSKDGYTVSCTVTDDRGVDRVQFPTWTTYNGQDDLFSNWQENTAARGTASGSTYTYRVLASAHNGETGTYQTHIYAYDIYGNSTCYNQIGDIAVPTPVDDVSLNQTMLSFTGLNNSETLTATVYPSNATDKTLTWKSSDTGVATVSGGKVTSTGFGSAEITATASNGISAVCTVFVLRPTYTVHYDANGGTGEPMNQLKTYDVDLTLSGTVPTFTGHAFLGWATSPTGNVVYAPEGIYTSNANATLYAVWREDAYAVHYDANGGSGAPADQTKTYGVDLTLSSAEPTRPGYTFMGWALSPTGNVVYAPGGKYTSNANATLYAVWKANTYTVHYDANGGSGAPADQTKTYGVDLTLSSAEPTLAGYTFQGWATNKTGGAVYAPGGQYTANAGATLYAVWEKAGVPVTGFALKEQLVTVEVGKQATLEPVFTPADATNRNVSWSSLSPSVATVDAGGTVTGVGVGTAMIKAVCEDSGAAVYARVTVKKQAVLKLPDGLIEIEEEAFAGDTSIGAVQIGDNTERIGSRAFKGCTNLKEIWIPDAVTDIALDAFDGCPDLTIHCKKGSTAWETALLKGIAFETDM